MRRPRSLAKLLLAVGVLASVAACGQKGPLRLPPPPQAAPAAAAPAASTPASGSATR